VNGLPAGWVATEIGIVTRIETGGTPPKAQVSYFGGPYPFFKPGDLDQGGLLQGAQETLSAEGLNMVRCLPARSVLVTCIGNLGKSGVTAEEAASNQQINALLPTDAAEPWYIYYWTRTIRSWLEENSSATTVSIINKSRFSRAPINLAPLAEQRRIVAKLDALTARTARARTDLDRIPALAARYKQALLTKAFSGELSADWRDGRSVEPWKQTTLKNSFKVVTGNTPPKGRADCYGGEIPFVKPGDLDSGHDIESTADGLTETGFALARHLPAGTTLVSCIGNLGKVGLLAKPGSCNQQINAILPSPIAAPRFIYYWAHTLREWLEESSSATTIAIVNKSRFECAKINLPALAEQVEIVRRIDQAFAEIDRLTAEAAAARRLLDRLDQAVLAKAFRGELVPQDPADEPASVLLDQIRAERAAAPKAKRGGRPKMASPVQMEAG
jgi:type I restriction enzyme S subunit